MMKITKNKDLAKSGFSKNSNFSVLSFAVLRMAKNSSVLRGMSKPKTGLSKIFMQRNHFLFQERFVRDVNDKQS